MAAPDLSEGKHFSRKVAKNAKKNAYFGTLLGLLERGFVKLARRRGRLRHHKAGIRLDKPGGATDQASDFGQ